MFPYVQKSTISTLVLLLTIVISSIAQADCHVEANALYKSFKLYRETINSASKLKDLTKFFSKNFNAYFTAKLKSADNKDVYQTYLTQYWENLNTAKDIVIVFDYKADCYNSNARLILISILRPEITTISRKVEFWKVTIRYINEHDQWRIDSFDYDMLNSRKKYSETDIKDNFINIR